MNFTEIALARQSCRSYDPRPVEEEKLAAVLEAARLAPSACNGQPYHLTVCQGELAAQVAAATVGPGGMNRFAAKAPVQIVLSEAAYVKTAAFGAKVKGNDYRSIDIGIAAAYLTAEAAAQGLGTCILGWFDDEKIRALCGLDQPARLVITLGYPSESDPLRPKRRKAMEELVTRLP